MDCVIFNLLCYIAILLTFLFSVYLLIVCWQFLMFIVQRPW
jgi:hypothetical protein